MNAMQPMRTLTVMEMLDRTFRIYRENFLTCIGLVAAVSIPITIIQLLFTASNLSDLDSALLTTSNANRQQLAGLNNYLTLAFLVAGVLGLVQLVLVNGPITYIASESYFGRKVSIGEAFGETRRRFFSLGCGFLVFSFVIGVFTFVVFFIGSICAPVWLALGIVVYAGIAIYVSLVPVITLENVSVSVGVNRAWSLGRARFWQAFGLLIAIGLITYIISLAFAAVGQLLIVQGLSGASFMTRQITSQILSALISVFILPLIPIGLTLLYYDTRIRVEGLDIALEALENPDARPADLESPMPRGGLNQTDWRNIIILTLGSIVLTVALGGLMVTIFRGLVPSL